MNINFPSSCIMGSPSSSSVIGDYIGIESCLDLKDNDDVFVSSVKEKESNQICDLRRSRKEEKWAAMKKEFPPAIPLLARTENLPGHMPWVLKRYYTSDGRLILREERVRHHGYFRAERCNGRLTLQLVPLDDEIYHHPHEFSQEDDNENGSGIQDELITEEKGKEGTQIEKSLDGEESEKEDKNENEKRPNEEEEEESPENGSMEKKLEHDEDEPVTSMDNGNGVNGGNVNAFKCFNYNRLTTRPGSTSIFEMPVLPMKPIHS